MQISSDVIGITFRSGTVFYIKLELCRLSIIWSRLSACELTVVICFKCKLFRLPNIFTYYITQFASVNNWTYSLFIDRSGSEIIDCWYRRSYRIGFCWRVWLLLSPLPTFPWITNQRLQEFLRLQMSQNYVARGFYGTFLLHSMQSQTKH